VHARAVRLADALAPGATPADVATLARLLALHPLDDHPFTWQAAYEGHYRRDLLASLTPQAPAPDAPHTQVVLCIDPRSEGLRRHLETDAGIETFGFAGFFGVPVRFATYEGRGSIDSLPALLQPKHAVTEAPADADRARTRTRGLRALDAASHSLHVTENATATPFALAEATGFLFGVSSVVRTLAPTLHHTLTRRWRDRIAPPVDSRVTIASAFTVEERTTLAEAGLRMMGLGRFAPLVVLAGHGSVSTNNLYQAALDCGACGGNPGAVNARAAAEIFNDPEVRALLAARGLEIPAGTHFVAALHDTVADRVTILDPRLIPDSHAPLVNDFTARADAAADGLVRERAVDLPGADAADSLARLRARAHDWAEVYPELGLAGNAAMIIGPREMTRSANLRRRVFLHSYDAALDPEGTGLETILTAPVVVAQWINHQYYFSTLNPDTLGAGTKTIHNAIGGIGVLAGHSGDLQRGLPRQSVAVGDDLLHEPLRLSVVVQAPIDRISGIVSGNQVLRDLFDNEWISLTARSSAADPWWTYTALGWAPTPTTTPTPTSTSTPTVTRTETP
ncbi:MAG: putative inorganic carbon transporter subunit DabA, partial [Microbacterium aurantiacum]